MRIRCLISSSEILPLHQQGIGRPPFATREGPLQSSWRGRVIKEMNLIAEDALLGALWD